MVLRMPAGLAVMGGSSMQIEQDVWVTVRYRLYDSQGEPIEEGEREWTYLHGGYGSVFPRIEAALAGRSLGDTASFYLEPEDTFGDYDAELLKVVPRDRFPGLLEAEHGSLLAWDEGGAAEVGRAVLLRLGTPAAVLEAIEGMWQGYLAMPPQSLADTLLLADHLAPVESPLSQLAGTGREGVEAHIDVALDDQTLSSILLESAAEVESLINALRA